MIANQKENYSKQNSLSNKFKLENRYPLNRKETLQNKKHKLINLYTKKSSAKSINKNGFAFSMGLKILKGNTYDNNKKKFIQKSKSINLIKKDKNSNNFHFIAHFNNNFMRKITKSENLFNIKKGIKTYKSITFFKKDEESKELVDLYNKYIGDYVPKIIKKLNEVENC